MFMFSKKGSVLLFIGIGLLLSLPGRSGAITCFDQCWDNSPCDTPTEKDCGKDIVNCAHGERHTDNGMVEYRRCGDASTLPGCTPVGCFCKVDHCNDGKWREQLKKQKESSSGTGSSSNKDKGSSGAPSSMMMARTPTFPIFFLGALLPITPLILSVRR